MVGDVLKILEITAGNTKDYKKSYVWHDLWGAYTKITDEQSPYWDCRGHLLDDMEFYISFDYTQLAYYMVIE